MRQPDNAPCVGASVVSAAVPVRKTADTPTRARQSSVFPGACVRGKHSAWPSTAPRTVPHLRRDTIGRKPEPTGCFRKARMIYWEEHKPKP